MLGGKRWSTAIALGLVLGPLSIGAGCDTRETVGGDGGANGTDSGAVVICGDGIMAAAEECDDGAANSDSAPDACRTDCTLARCGDSAIDTGETCDDGFENSDIVPNACRADCTPPSCGDGIVDFEFGETCDDGNTQNGDGCADNGRRQRVAEQIGSGTLS